VPCSIGDVLAFLAPFCLHPPTCTASPSRSECIVAPAGDLDADGHADFVVTSRRTGIAAAKEPFLVVSGFDGTTLKDLSAAFGDRQLDRLQGLPFTIDRDRVLLAHQSRGEDPLGRIELLNLATGRVVRSWSAEAVAAKELGGVLCPDWNGDGLSDVLLTTREGLVIPIESGTWKAATVPGTEWSTITRLMPVVGYVPGQPYVGLCTFDDPYVAGNPSAALIRMPECKLEVSEELGSALAHSDRFNGAACVLAQREESGERVTYCALGVSNRLSFEVGEVIVVRIAGSVSSPTVRLHKRIRRDHITFGESLLCPGDIDGDGAEDLILSASWRVRTDLGPFQHSEEFVDGAIAISLGRDESLFSVASGACMYSEHVRVETLGDVDADGVSDFSMSWRKCGPQYPDREVLSGKDGSVLYTATVSGDQVHVRRPGSR
jgi:hypothetical protein